MTATELKVIVGDLERIAERATTAINALRDLYALQQRFTVELTSADVEMVPAVSLKLIGTDADNRETLRARSAELRPDKPAPVAKAAASTQKPQAHPRPALGASRLHEPIMKTLAASKSGLSPAELAKRFSAEPDWRVRLALKELKTAGKVTAVGATLNLRYLLADFHPTPATFTPRGLAMQAITDALNAGISYDKRELLRIGRNADATVEMDYVEKLLAARVDIERIQTQAGDRYKLRGKAVQS